MSKIKVYPVSLFHDRADTLQPANGSLLPLGLLFAYAKKYKDGLLNDYFDFQQIVVRYPDEWDFYIESAKSGDPAIWIFSSYIWIHKDNMEMARRIKEVSRDSLIVVGGPHIPAYEEENRKFHVDHPFIDIAARGAGEVTLAEILETIRDSQNLHADFSKVGSITFRSNHQLIRTRDRERTRNIDIFPSPYLTGEYDHPSIANLPVMVLETNRGCPFGCTFCDWGSATLQKISQFDLERVKSEIEIVSQKKAGIVYLADSNFGSFERDIEIAKFFVECKKKYGYPTTFATSFAKNASARLAKIIKILSDAKLTSVGLISIQSTDPETLSAIHRSNIKNEKYDVLLEIFKKEKLNLSSELMIGLPGQTVSSFKDDLQFFIDRKIVTTVYSTAVMPNSPMNDPAYREKYKIVTDEDGYVLSTSTATEEERDYMVKLYFGFQFFYATGLLKYYLYYLQMEHGIRIIDFIDSFIQESTRKKADYPFGYKIQDTILFSRVKWWPMISWTSQEGEFLFNQLDDFYAEIIKFTKNHYGITFEKSVENTIIEAQKAVMPSMGKTLPYSVSLDHDIVPYMQQIKDMRVVDHVPKTFKKLGDFSSGELKVSSLRNRTIDSVALLRFDRYSGAGIELKSPLRFHT